MDYETLLNFYTELSALEQSGDEEKARELIGKRFAELPEDVQGEIITRLYFKGLEEQVEETEIMAEIQEKGLAALDVLDAMKKKLETETVDK